MDLAALQLHLRPGTRYHIDIAELFSVGLVRSRAAALPAQSARRERLCIIPKCQRLPLYPPPCAHRPTEQGAGESTDAGAHQTHRIEQVFLTQFPSRTICSYF